MIVFCPSCQSEEEVDDDGTCQQCGVSLEPLQLILLATQDSLRLGLEALREARDQDALDYAYEAWGLKKTYETAALGLLAAARLADGMETTRWLRRRHVLKQH